MLVLRRRTEESLIIYAEQEIEIVLLDSDSQHAKLGINAPLKYRILRTELLIDKTIRVTTPSPDDNGIIKY